MTERWLIINWFEIGLVPFVIVGILLLMFTVRFFAQKFDLSSELQRKIVHVAVGIASLFFPLIFSSPLPVLILIATAIMVMLVMRRGRTKQQGIGSVLHSVSRPSYGEIYLALAVAFLFFRSEANAVLYVLPLLVITLSDTASALVGTTYGRIRFAVEEGTKSIEGVVAFFMVTWISAMIVLLLMSDAGRINVILLSFLIAAFCALVEADSWRGLDNIFVPIGAHLLLQRYVDTAPSLLLFAAIVFVGFIFLSTRFSGALGITKHEARSRTILIFLILTVTHPVNAVLPFCAILAHTLACRMNPCASRSPVLDLVAASAAVGLLSLLAGEAIDKTTITLFNLAFAGAAVIYLTLALAAMPKDSPLRHSLLPVAAALVAACSIVAHFNDGEALWYDPIWPPILISVFLSAYFAWSKPEWFKRWRNPKAFGIALIVPTVLFVVDGALV